MRQEWIEDLLAVLDTGSLTAAAEQRFLTQSAFTRRIRAIETALGADLFDRNRKPLQLLPHILEQEQEMRRLVVRLNGLRNAMLNPQPLSGSRVSLACQHTIATTISPGLIRQLTREGELNVTVRASNRDNCLMMLLRAEVDLAIVYDIIGEVPAGERIGLLEESLGTDRMVPVVATEFADELVRIFDNGVLRMVSYPSSVYFGSLFELNFLGVVSQDCQIVRAAETGLALAALHYTLEGIGIGWLPLSIASADIESGKLRLLTERLPSHDMRIKIVRLRDTISPLAEDVWNRIAVEYRSV